MTARSDKPMQRRPLVQPVSWGARVILAAGLTVMGYFGVSDVLAAALARNNTELAHRMAPVNAQIAARFAMMLSGADATKADRKRADQLARQALLRDPTAVAAVTTLGLNADIGGNKAAARRLFAYAQVLSRRNIPTQIWAIEDAVGRNDIAGALKHYDIALRTSPETSDLLFPVLATASVNPEVRNALVRMLGGKPAWGDAFVHYLVEKGADPRTTAALLVELSRRNVPAPDTAQATLVNALVTKGYADDAWNYYRLGRTGVDRGKSRDPEFTANIDSPSLLDWMPIDTPGISSSIQRGDRGGVFEYSAPGSIGGPLLRQLEMLPPGTYRLAGSGSGIDQSDGERPYWLLTCHDGRELGRVEIPKLPQSGGAFAGNVVVPSGCGIQTLQLIARPTSTASGLSGQIDRLQLGPVQ